MSPELMAILLTSLLEVAVLFVLGLQLRYVIRIQRALAGLVVQESENI